MNNLKCSKIVIPEDEENTKYEVSVEMRQYDDTFEWNVDIIQHKDGNDIHIIDNTGKFDFVISSFKKELMWKVEKLFDDIFENYKSKNKKYE